MDSDHIYRTLGARIKARRKHLAMTQETVADAIGTSRASLANIETGRQKVLVHTLVALARALKMNVADLLPSDEPVAAGVVELSFSEKLTPEQQAQVARVLMGAAELSVKSES